MGTSEPATTIVLDVFLAYRQGGLRGWYKTRRLVHAALEGLEGPGILLSGTGLVENEEAILDNKTRTDRQ